MKLEVGMYVRTDDGIIAKLIDKEIEEKGNVFIFDKELYSVEYEYDSVEHIKELTDFKSYMSYQGKTDIIKKASFNLIDLIEEGDILKIHLYDEIYCIVEVEEKVYDKNNKYVGVYIPWHEGSQFEELKDIDIKEVLTHEQYNSNKYVVERNDNNE